MPSVSTLIALLTCTSLPVEDNALLGLGHASTIRTVLEASRISAHLTAKAPPLKLPSVTDIEAFDYTRAQNHYDIPLATHPLVAHHIRLFQGVGRKWFRVWMSRSTRYLPVMQPILEAHGLPRDVAYLAMIESGFSTHAKSRAKAVGPWQFIAHTAKHFQLKNDFWVDERRDPIKATHAAAKYLKKLYRSTGHWYLAWAGYNAGGRRVRKLMKAYDSKDFWELAKQDNGLPKETRHYVPKLLAAALIAKHPAAFGFSMDEFDFQPPLAFEVVQLKEAVDLAVLAKSAGTSVKALKTLNPELKRWCTPPATRKAPYALRLPVGTKQRFASNFARVKPKRRFHALIHTVAKGDTLWQLAMTYNTPLQAIIRFNRLSTPRALRINSKLVIPMPKR